MSLQTLASCTALCASYSFMQTHTCKTPHPGTPSPCPSRAIFSPPLTPQASLQPRLRSPLADVLLHSADHRSNYLNALQVLMC
jgi:hypothetical protein